MRALGWLVSLTILGCGRVGVHLLPLKAMPTDAGMSSRDAATLPNDAMAANGVDASNVSDASTAMMCDGSACGLPVCSADAGKSSAGICGCGVSDATDSDGDGVPDCIDFCPGAPDRLADGECGCAGAQADADGDGVANCDDSCPYDPAKSSAGVCGCGAAETDSDSDGTPDCIDACPNDPNKTQPGACGCGVSDQDTDLDGTPDCLDRCSGAPDSMYTPIASCGVGYCLQHNMPSTCKAGVETACIAGMAISAVDSSCDGSDDDCDGKVDENFVAQSSSCGVGACMATGMLRCVSGKPIDSCSAALPATMNDATCDGIDDDCDGKIDENFVVKASSCSVGACASTGSIACVTGMMVDSCAARSPVSANDATCDNIDDDCDGVLDENFMSASTNCGVGVCARSGSTSCTRGSTLNSCTAGSPTSTLDTSCNNKDDNCNGRIDEDFVPAATSCGNGACISSGTTSCVAGVTKNSCVAKTPATSSDDSFAPGNGIDDDCDGKVDEDVPACNTSPFTFDAGSYPNITVPGNCHSVSARVWGGGGASGQTEGVASGGEGGPGGYATTTALVSGTLTLYVGGGAASGCNGAGTNAGSASYAGGSGGSSTGANGADGAAAGGGAGGQPGTGKRGGNGYYGGGGGGQGSGGLGASGNGGGGGAASLLMVNGVRAAVAGGGGGGGGTQSLDLFGLIAAAGGAGGSGCGKPGLVGSGNGGGGGGGGTCLGASTQAGSGTAPASTSGLPSGRAAGGTGSCVAGGAGYAILTFSP